MIEDILSLLAQGLQKICPIQDLTVKKSLASFTYIQRDSLTHQSKFTKLNGRLKNLRSMHISESPQKITCFIPHSVLRMHGRLTVFFKKILIWCLRVCTYELTDSIGKSVNTELAS